MNFIKDLDVHDLLFMIHRITRELKSRDICSDTSSVFADIVPPIKDTIEGKDRHERFIAILRKERSKIEKTTRAKVLMKMHKVDIDLDYNPMDKVITDVCNLFKLANGMVKDLSGLKGSIDSQGDKKVKILFENSTVADGKQIDATDYFDSTRFPVYNIPCYVGYEYSLTQDKDSFRLIISVPKYIKWEDIHINARRFPLEIQCKDHILHIPLECLTYYSVIHDRSVTFSATFENHVLTIYGDTLKNVKVKQY